MIGKRNKRDIGRPMSPSKIYQIRGTGATQVKCSLFVIRPIYQPLENEMQSFPEAIEELSNGKACS